MTYEINQFGQRNYSKADVINILTWTNMTRFSSYSKKAPHAVVEETHTYTEKYHTEDERKRITEKSPVEERFLPNWLSWYPKAVVVGKISARRTNKNT